MKIIGINGSPNKDGNTAFLLKELKKEVEKLNVEFEIINVTDALKGQVQPFCVNCSSPCEGNCIRNTNLEEAYNKITNADALVVGSPVYFGNVSAQLKAFFDKSISIRKKNGWIGKIGASLSVGGSKYGGQETTLMAINNFLFIQGFTLVSESDEEFNAGHFGVCAHKPSNEDEFALSRIKVLASRLVKEIAR